MNKANPVNLAVVAATNTVKAGLPRALDIGTEGPFSISNSEIANYINPGLLVGMIIFGAMVIAFLLGLHQLMSLQTPANMAAFEKSPAWGKVEEQE